MRIRTRSFIIMLSQGLAQASTIALGICLVRMIDQSTFGTYRQAMLVLSSASAILSLQFEVSLYYYIPKLPVEQHRALVVQTVGMGLLSSGMSSLVMFFGADIIAAQFENPDIALPVRILSLYPLTERLLVFAPAFHISSDRAVRASIFSLSASVGRVASVLIAFGIGGSLVTAAWSMVGVSMVITTFAVIDMVRYTPSVKVRIDWELVKGQFGYCIPLLMTALVAVLNREYDKFLISTYYGDKVMYGIYSCGAMELPVIGIITSSVTSAIMPNLVTLTHENKMREAVFVWQEAARKCSMVILPVFAFLVSMPVDFIEMMYGPAYMQASWPFTVYLMVLPLRVAIYATMLRATGNTKPVAVYAAIGLVFNIILGTTLIHLGQRSWFSFVAPSMGTVVATSVMATLLLRRVCQITKMTPRDIMRWDELLRILLFSLAAACVTLAVPTIGFHGWRIEFELAFKIAIKAVLFVTAFLALVWGSGFLTADERRLVLTPLRLLKGGKLNRPA